MSGAPAIFKRMSGAPASPFLKEGAMSDADRQEAQRMGKKFIQDATVKNLPRTKHLNTNSLLSAIPPDEAKLASYS
jgi:hypothetical protein